MRIYSLLTAIGLIVGSQLSAHSAGDWLVRARAIDVMPVDSTSKQTGAVVGSTISVHSALVPELDISYMVTDNIGLELILATSKHSLHGEGALAGTKIGDTWMLPPTLTLQYHFMPCSCYQPYIGAGVNYTVTYSEDTPLAGTTLSLDNPFGAAVQAGMDVELNDCWFFNLDVKYIWVPTEARLTGTTSGTADVDLNPWVFGAGIGRRF